MNVREFVTNLRYKVDDSGRKRYESGLQAIRQTVQRVRDQAVRSFNSMGQSFSGVTQGMGRRWESTMNSLRRASSAAASKINADIAGMGKNHNVVASQIKQLAAAYAGYQVGAKFVDTVKSQEQINNALELSVGNPEKAKKKYSDLEFFANKYGQKIDDVSASFLRLNNIDLDSSNTALLAYGNIASSTRGKTTIDFVESVADAVTGEYERLKEFAIKSKKEGDMVTFALGKNSITVKNTGKEVERALQALANKKFGGALEKQAGSLGNLLVAFENRFVKFSRMLWETKLGPTAKNAIKAMLNSSDKILAQAQTALPKIMNSIIDTGTKALPLVTMVFDVIRASAPIAAAAIGLIASRYIGLKAIAVGGWIIRAISFMRGLTLSTVLLNAAAFAIPIAVGAAIAAIGYIGYEVWRYFTQGKGIIADLAKRFPALKQALDEYGEKMRVLWSNVQPILQHIGETMMEIGQIVMPLLAKAAGWLFDNVLIPAVIQALKWVSQFLDDLMRGYEIVVPALMQAFEDWKAGMEKIWAWLEEKVPWLLEALGKVGEVAGNAFGGVASALGLGGDGSGGGVSSAMAQYSGGLGGKLAQFAKAQAMAAGGFTSLGKCAYYVEAALEQVGIQYRGHAFQLKEQLDRDKRFRRVEVSDAEMKSLPPGAITVHDRNPANAHLGKGALYGHVEVSLGNGQAASDYVGNQMVDHYAGGKRFVYIPIDNRVQVPMNGGAGGAGGGGTNVTVQQNFGPAAATPAAVKKAAEDGVNKGLNKAAKNTPKLTS